MALVFLDSSRYSSEWFLRGTRIMESRTATSLCKLASRSVMVFTLTILVSSIVTAFWHGFVLHIPAIAMLAHSPAVGRGERWSATLVLVLTWYYLLAGAALFIGGAFFPSELRWGDQALEPNDLLWIITVGAIVLPWSLINVVLLVKVRRRLKPKPTKATI